MVLLLSLLNSSFSSDNYNAGAATRVVPRWVEGMHQRALFSSPGAVLNIASSTATSGFDSPGELLRPLSCEFDKKFPTGSTFAKPTLLERIWWPHAQDHHAAARFQFNPAADTCKTSCPDVGKSLMPCHRDRDRPTERAIRQR